MVNLVHLEHDGLDDVVDDQLEVGVPQPLVHVALSAREHVVHHDHLVTRKHQAVNEVAADESGASGHQDAHPLVVREDLHGAEACLRGHLGNRLRVGKLVAYLIGNDVLNLGVVYSRLQVAFGFRAADVATE